MGRKGAKTQVHKGERVLRAFSVSALSLISAIVLTPSSDAHAQLGGTRATLSTQINPSSSSRIRRAAMAWNLGMDGQSFANEKDQAQVAGFGLGAKLRYRLLPGLLARADAGLSLQTGYAQSRFGDNTPKSGINLKEAVLQYRPMSMLTLQAGAIAQSRLEAPLLVSSGAFPGVLERLNFGTRELGAAITAQQTVPTSTTLSTKAVESESTPTFMTETLSLHARVFDALSVKGSAGHYAFRSLPNTVAYESEAFGNTVREVGPSSAKFAYDFEGWLAGAEVKWQVLRGLGWKVGALMIQNTKAPDSYKNGQMTSTGLDIALPRQIDFEPKGFVFFNESDVAPAYYNSSELGHNNRQGWGASADFKFRKEKFKIGAAYVNSDIINPSANQSRQQFIRLQFETLYEML